MHILQYEKEMNGFDDYIIANDEFRISELFLYLGELLLKFYYRNL